MVQAIPFGLLSLVVLSRLVSSAPTPDSEPSSDSDDMLLELLAPDFCACNTAANRASWMPGFDITTDYEAMTPMTGATRKYTLTVTEHKNWMGPDGHVKEVAMLINNQLPGPSIVADWGDFLEITVINKLETNGTSFHWHGVRQMNSNTEDGVNGLTECPIPPGHSRVYRFRAMQHGTSWYHSHFEAQLGNGVFGTMHVNGPASAPYDIDLGVFPMHDWYWEGVDAILGRVISTPGPPPASDNILFNGTNVNPGGGTGGPGKHAVVKVEPGKKHRLRLINLSVENAFTVSVVGHTMTVISIDWVPVKAHEMSSLFLNVGQRYDVIIEANNTCEGGVGNFWINATFSSTGACGASNNKQPAAILRYAGAADALPTDPGTAPPDSLCQDFTGFEPILSRAVPPHDPVASEKVSVDLVTSSNASTGATSVFWRVNQSAIDIRWDKPTLEYIAQKNTSYPPRLNAITIPDENKWTYFVVHNLSPVPHPMHLHGHDVSILGHSPAPAKPLTAATVNFTSADVATLNFTNPTRRDVTTLPAAGWLVIAHRNDNPGAWLFHCHIAWHLSQGLSVQFVEQPSRIPLVMDLQSIEPNCDAWRRYAPTNPFPKIASGL